MVSRADALALIEDVDSDFYDGDLLGPYGGYYTVDVDPDLGRLRIAGEFIRDPDRPEPTTEPFDHRWILTPVTSGWQAMGAVVE